MNAKSISAVLLSTGMALASFSAMAFDTYFLVHCSVEDDKYETIICLDVSHEPLDYEGHMGKTSDEYAGYKGMVIHGENNQKYYLEGYIPSEEGFYNYKSLGRPDHLTWPSHLEISDDQPNTVPIFFHNADDISHYITDWIE